MAGIPFRRVCVSLLLLAACRDSDPTGQPERPAIVLRVTPDSAHLFVGDTINLSTTITHLNAVPLNEPVSWSSSDSSVAQVWMPGRIVARSPGSALIIARVAGQADTVLLRVRSRLPATCDSPGPIRTGQVGTEVWTAVQSPHVLRDTVLVTGELIIEPGALVCGLPNSTIQVQGGMLRALGTARDPIRFMATDSARGWDGITAGGYPVGGSALFNHTRFEFGKSVTGSIQIDSSHLRRTSVVGTIRHSIVDTADVALHGGTFEETIVRAGQLTLYTVNSLVSGGITLNGGRIEDSPGFALTIGSTFSFRIPNVTVLKAPIITGSKGGIAITPAHVFFELWPTAREQEPLLANIDRTVSLWSGDFGDLDLRAGLSWVLWGPVGVPVVGDVTIQPGATVKFASYFNVTGAMRAVGTSTQPIVIASTVCQSPPHFCGLFLRGNATSRFSNVRFTNVTVTSTEQHVAVLDHIDTNGALSLGVAGSLISDAAIHDVAGGQFADAALVLGADNIIAHRVSVRGTLGHRAVRIGGNNVKLFSCEVRDNGDDGVVVTAGEGIEIHDCALERNGGVAVRNRTAALVNAQRNWWGDPGGPFGAAGDGIEGVVDFSQHLTERPSSNYHN